MTPDGLDGELEVAVGDTAVDITFVVTNTGAEPVDLEFRSGKVADVVVRGDGDREGGEVWRWSEGRMFTQAIRTETLASGGSLSHECTCEDLSPGAYTAEATLEATDATLSERAAFEVPEPDGSG